MSTLSIPDIRLRSCTLDSLPRLQRLRTKHFADKDWPEVCIERAVRVTEYLRDMASPHDSAMLQYAKAVNHFLSHKAPLFFDDNLLAGTTTSHPFGAPVYPEQTGMSIWPELETIGRRGKNPQSLSDQDAEKLNLDVFPFWLDRTILEHARNQHGNLPCMKLFQQLIFFIASKAGCISHTVPDFNVVLAQGLEGIIATAKQKAAALGSGGSLSEKERGQKDFYESVQIALQGLIAYAANLSREASDQAAQESDPARRSLYLELAEICAQVPAKPARTFREAVNSLWLCQVGILAENINMAMSPGRLDQVLYPYYAADVAKGTLTPEEAVELVGCLWLKLTDNTNLVPESAEELFGGAGPVPAVTVGGVDSEGEDAVNDLTYVVLRATELLNVRDPSLNARYHCEKNPQEYRDRVCEVIASTRAVPAFHNDIADIKTLVNQGVSLPHARDYAIIGCVELSSSGRSYDASSSIILNLVAPLELALYNGQRPAVGDQQVGPRTGDPATFSSFAQFWTAFETQLSWVIEQAIELNEILGRTYQQIMPSPLLSGLFTGPLEKGRDLIFGGALYNSSGATQVGFADTVDSLNAIEHAVFVAKECTFAELIAALRANFKGKEPLRQFLLNQAPKYGTDSPQALENSQRLVRFLYETYQSHVNYRGGSYRPAYWSMTNHAGQGKLAGALPSGRKAAQVFASGITPVSQAATEVTSCLQAVASLGSCCIPGGFALNLKFPEVRDREQMTKVAEAVDTYFQSGGMHVQFNIMSYRDLMEARAHPKEHDELLVRVSGYSAYFNGLNDAMKEEIITRTAYDVDTGQALPLPPNARSG